MFAEPQGWTGRLDDQPGPRRESLPAAGAGPLGAHFSRTAGRVFSWHSNWLRGCECLHKTLGCVSGRRTERPAKFTPAQYSSVSCLLAAGGRYRNHGKFNNELVRQKEEHGNVALAPGGEGQTPGGAGGRGRGWEAGLGEERGQRAGVRPAGLLSATRLPPVWSGPRTVTSSRRRWPGEKSEDRGVCRRGGCAQGEPGSASMRRRPVIPGHAPVFPLTGGCQRRAGKRDRPAGWLGRWSLLSTSLPRQR